METKKGNGNKKKKKRKGKRQTKKERERKRKKNLIFCGNHSPLFRVCSDLLACL